MALVGNEVLYVNGIAPDGSLAATLEETTTGAIANLAAIGVFPNVINTAITTVGAGTLTAAGIVGGLITRTGSVAAYTDTTATAVQIVAALSAYVATESFYLHIRNNTAFNETITNGSGVTITGSAIIPPFSDGVYLVTINSATAVTLLHVATSSLTSLPIEAITTISTVGAGTLTAAGIANGVISRTGSQSASPFTDTTATAAAIIAARPNIGIGQSWEFTYINTTNAVATLAGDTGVTVSGITAVNAGETVRYLVTYTAAATLTVVAISVGQAAATMQSAILAGSTSGTTTVLSGATAGSSVITLPVATDTLVGKATTDTLTNKTINGAVYATDNAVASATLTLTSSTTLTNVVGMVVTVVPGTYKFRVDAPCVSTANTGIKVGFKLTTAVITSGAISGKGISAAGIKMAAYSTTVTDQALWYDTTAGVDLKIELDGTLVIGTGGTLQFQMGQHTSHGDSTSIYAGAYMSFTRIA